jgi:hypothetical protein
LETEADKYHHNPSAIITKRKGDNGSPWQMSREGEKGLDGTPFTSIEKKVEELSFMIQAI